MTRRVFLVVLVAAALRGACDQLAVFLSVRLRPTMRLKASFVHSFLSCLTLRAVA